MMVSVTSKVLDDHHVVLQRTPTRLERRMRKLRASLARMGGPWTSSQVSDYSVLQEIEWERTCSYDSSLSKTKLDEKRCSLSSTVSSVDENYTPITSPSSRRSKWLRVIIPGNKLEKRQTSQGQALLPSYQEAQLEQAWRKIGIDIHNKSHGPKPQCTPEQWAGAFNSFFGEKTA